MIWLLIIDMVAIGICIGTFGSFFLLYSRKSTWVTKRTKLLFTFLLFLIGIVLLALSTDNKELFVLGWGMAMPFAFQLLTDLFDFISMKVYGRRYILWLQWSDEIDTSFGAINDEIGILDIVFSLASVALIFGLIVYAVI